MVTLPFPTVRGLVTLLAVFAVAAAPGHARAQDAAAGEKVFARCRACHQVGEAARNGIGPKLNGVVGAHSAAVAEYRYSDALRSADLVWNGANLADYLRRPAAKVPGTKMAYPGLPNDKDVADVITYLGRVGPDGKPKP